MAQRAGSADDADRSEWTARNEPGVRFEVVALVTSAGGLPAITSVLSRLAPDFPAAVVVAQHLGGQGSMLREILERRVSLPVQWARDGAPVEPGRVTVCPPRSVLEILPDGTCALRPSEGTLSDRPLDALLSSVGDSYGARALAVVLTGMGKDGAVGTRAVREAGGTVLAQDEETAEQPSMPRAAAEAGAHLVLPLHEIGTVVAQIVAGGDLPLPRTEVEAVEALFAGSGGVRAELRQIDWSATPLGPVTSWSPGLRTIVRAVLDSDFPMFVMWGPELVQIGNDAYAPTLGAKRMQGRPVRATWPELWDVVGPKFDQVRRTGQPVFARDAEYSPNRGGFVEEAYFTYCYSALHDEGRVAGVLETSLETTERVLAERRLSTVRALATSAVGADSIPAACERAVRVLEENPRDIPFALLYLNEQAHKAATLCASSGLKPGSAVAPRTLSLLPGDMAWPVGRVLETGVSQTVDGLPSRFGVFHAGPWPEVPNSAVALPLRPAAEEPPLGVLVLGFSPRLVDDDSYRGFFELVAAQISAGIAEARNRGRERARLDRLAELDRLKTEFFSNVSHEFRTPLTLMLGPLEDLLHAGDGLPPERRADLELVRRNGRRLLHLVSTMLDFSQIEAGRLRARLVPVDLAERTQQIVGQFHSAAERAGVELRVKLDELPEPVWVDVEMWEKIVSNLLSNALKFTFDGEIEVTLRALPGHAELVVRDTGVGIPDEELPNIFKRFHRVRDMRARTYEGAGIGLALVDELVRRHHGRIRAASIVGEGTTFTVWIPRVRRPTMPDARPEPAPATAVAAALAEEASQWGETPGEESLVADDSALGQSLRAFAPDARVLVADDNTDMRHYLKRLLSRHWAIETASDGTKALALARRNPPDLILADVMMPGLDGFGLLRELREDAALTSIPVVLLTARAGEESAIEGLLAGAHDYIVKPFSARELVARIGAQLELARARNRAFELNEFLVGFSDIARSLCEPKAVAEAACRMVLEPLRATRAAWAEIDRDTGEYVADCIVLSDGTRAEASRWPLDANDPFATEHHAGRAVVYLDSATDPRISDRARRKMADHGLQSGIAVPVAVDGQLCAVLSVSHEQSRSWTPEEVALVEALAGRTWAEIERTRAELAVRESEERQTFLLKLSDALRPLADAGTIRETASRLLAEHLDVNRVLYAEVDGDEWLISDAYEHDVPQLAPGRHEISQFGQWIIDTHRAGELLVFNDLDSDARFDAAQRKAHAAISIRAGLAVPLVKDHILVAILTAHSARPREWRPHEISLVKETAERTWAAVERARAERALQDREGWLRGQRAALEAALHEAPLAESLEILVQTAIDALGPPTRAAFYLADDVTSLHLVAGMNDAYAEAVDGFAIGPESLACGLAVASGQPVLTADVHDEPLWEPWQWLAEKFDYRGCWSFPILAAGGTFIGSLAIYSQQPRAPTQRELELATLLTQTASIIVARDESRR